MFNLAIAIIAALIVEPLPYVERAVFFSTPHRGSGWAANQVGKIGASLVGLPKDLVKLSQQVFLSHSDELTEEARERGKIPDSVQTLRPEHPLVLALNTLPIAPQVTYHTVVGDRGKGDTPDSTDGAVPYWSSHLDDAESEKIVPSGHSSHKHEAGIDELLRILHLHPDEAGP